MSQHCLELLTQAIQYKNYNPAALHNQLLGTIRDILSLLDKFPPLVTQQGVVTVREWLIGQGVDPKLITDASTPQP